MTDSVKRKPAVNLEEICSTLQRIAMQFKPETDEYRAIEEAAHAFLFLTTHENLKIAYEKYRKRCGKPLSRSQKAELRGMGIEP
jgi:hypothetical protein